MDATDTICAQCGASFPGARTGSVQRSIGLVLPAVFPASMILLGLNLVNQAVALALFGVGQMLNPTPLMLLTMGALDPYSFAQGEYWRLITYGFLHIGFMHILFNMMALSQVGSGAGAGGGECPVYFRLSALHDRRRGGRRAGAGPGDHGDSRAPRAPCSA
jgi:hypothetical protein